MDLHCFSTLMHGGQADTLSFDTRKLHALAKDFGQIGLQRLIDSFLECTPGYLDGLDRALQAGQLSCLGDIAHQLKSAASYLGADALAQASEELEELNSDNSLPPDIAIRLQRIRQLHLDVVEQLQGQWPRTGRPPTREA